MTAGYQPTRSGGPKPAPPGGPGPVVRTDDDRLADDIVRAVVGERVEDTRTLQPGDRVRVIVTGVIREPRQWMSESFLIAIEAGGVRPTGDDICLPVTHPQVEVYRLPKPLPPEPPVGAEVLGQDLKRPAVVLRRMDAEGSEWFAEVNGWSGPWSKVLRDFGPVRLLGDPIEAP